MSSERRLESRQTHRRYGRTTRRLTPFHRSRCHRRDKRPEDNGDLKSIKRSHGRLDACFFCGYTLEHYMSLLENESHQNNAMAAPVHRQIKAMELLCIDRPEAVVIQPVFT